MASLQKLLTEEGFEHDKFMKSQKKVKFKDRGAQDDPPIALPIYICRDRKSFDRPRQQNTGKALSRSGSSVYSCSGSERTHAVSVAEGILRRDEPAIDEVATKAVVSILSGYVGRYLKDQNFREMVRDKCYSCFLRKRKENDDNMILANMGLAIESVERLVESRGTKKELMMKSLRYSIRLLSIVASLNTQSSRTGSTSGTPNSHLSACAQLYLSIVYKLEKNDRISARHLLQAFVDSPFLARTHLLPDLWEHFFLPHLLHIKIWYTEELELLSSLDSFDEEKKIMDLKKACNDQMDIGTTQFALYYKDWLKVGGQAPAVPSVPLPSKLSHTSSRRRVSDPFTYNACVNNKSLHQTIFGSTTATRERRSSDLDDWRGAISIQWDFEERPKSSPKINNTTQCRFAQKRAQGHRRSLSQNCSTHAELWPETQKSDSFQFLSCRSERREHSVCSSDRIKKAELANIFPSCNLHKVITTICVSDNLRDCESAIRMLAKFWLDSQGHNAIVTTVSEVPAIEGILKVLYSSKNDEILELGISILAELVTKNEMTAQIILNADPQLDIFSRLMRSSSLFLKAAVLLYLLKPKAKQMISMEWIPLVLRVLEFGDQLQTLFTVQCSPHEASYYFLDQLLAGFDEDKFLENVRQIVSLGGLSLLARRMKTGDITEKKKAASITYHCIQAVGSCRHYLAKTLDKDSILSLLVLEKRTTNCGHALSLLAELFCLQRSTERSEFLNKVRSGWGSLSTFHILLVYLQKALPAERPIVAAILLQLDLLGDPFRCSIYRAEAIEALVKALDCQDFNKEIQEQSARALLILGGHFSQNGRPVTEIWMLRKAGFKETNGNFTFTRDVTLEENIHLNADIVAIENQQGEVAKVLLTSGNKRLLAALSDSIAKGIPCLSRASLVTVSWISCFLHSIEDKELQSVACLILVQQLIERLDTDKSLEDRVLASFSLLNLVKHTDCAYKLSKNKELLSRLQDLSEATWTSEELISIITIKPS